MMPTKDAPGTAIFNCQASAQIVDLVRKSAPRVAMIVRNSSGTNGIDIECRAEDASTVGFQFANIKPMTEYGYRSFSAQVARRKLPTSVLAITYDYNGNIYYGFAKLGKGSIGTEVLSHM